jgi:hypothetical protein
MNEWNASSRQCFVVSPIGEQGTERFETFRRVLEKLIRPAIEESSIGLEVIRADEIHRPGSFIRDVLEYLAQAYLVVVDLTGQNANVFYELGVRHALSPRTILIARATADIPADLREYRTLLYADTPENDEMFRQSLRNYLEEIEKLPDAPDNPVLSWLKLPQIPDDLRQTFTARLASVGSTQPEILRFIQNTTGAMGTSISQFDLENRFQQKRGEMYYRLEQLRLLGFITKDRSDDGEFTYRLSPAYRRELGLPEVVVNLGLVSQRGRTLPFGRSPDAPPAHFYYVKASNLRTARIYKTRVLLTRIRIFDDDGGILEDYSTKMQLKWQFATDRCAAKDINAREDAVANVGFVIKDHGFFQLDICADPWPPGFPARLDPRRRMRVDLAPEVAGAPALAGVSLDIAWDGNWSDDAAQMERHLVIKSIAGR